MEAYLLPGEGTAFAAGIQDPMPPSWRNLSDQVTRICGRKEKHMETLLQILNELHPDVDFTAENALIDDGVLDSLDIVTLITEINDKFDVEIPAEEILPENFNSATALYALIRRIDEE